MLGVAFIASKADRVDGAKLAPEILVELVGWLRGHDDERRAFAEWLAARMERAGQPVEEVVLIRRNRRIVDGRVRQRELGRFPTPAESRPR